MFDVSIRSRDIRNQSQKLSEIVPKFGCVLALPNFWRRAFQKLYAGFHPCLPARCLEKFHQYTLTSPEVIEAHMLNFKANFKFSPLKIFGGTPVPVVVCAR